MSIIKIVPAKIDDTLDILAFIKALASYEKLEYEMIATEEGLKKNLFGTKPMAEVLFILEDSKKVGFALFFTSFSTFLGLPGLYLEDLFILPEKRSRGYGKKLLSHLAKIAVERGHGRFEWSVLDWNTDALNFYKKMGAAPLTGWSVQRIAGDSLKKLAELSLE